MSAFLRSQWLCFPPCSALVYPCQQDRLRAPCLSNGGRYQSLTRSFVHSLAHSFIVQQVEWFPGARILPGNEESTVNKTGTSSPSWHQRTWVGRGYKPPGSSKTLVKRDKERIQRGKGVSVWGGVLKVGKTGLRRASDRTPTDRRPGGRECGRVDMSGWGGWSFGAEPRGGRALRVLGTGGGAEAGGGSPVRLSRGREPMASGTFGARKRVALQLQPARAHLSSPVCGHS